MAFNDFKKTVYIFSTNMYENKRKKIAKKKPDI